MTDWLSFSRDCVRDLEGVLTELPTRAEREPVLRVGEGGDDTTAIDAAAELAVVARLETLGLDLTLVSEELGLRTFGAGGALRVVVDPIDGSVNAKRGIPFFSISLAVADGETMDDVRFGFVYDFGAREEWVAERGRGAFLDGAPLDAPGPKDAIEILSLEGTTTDAIARAVPGLDAVAHRVRVMGSLALSLCHLAAGRVDAVCCLKPARSIDIAAAQLLVRERGYAIELFEDPPFGSAPSRPRTALARRCRRERRAVRAARSGALVAPLGTRRPRVRARGVARVRYQVPMSVKGFQRRFRANRSTAGEPSPDRPQRASSGRSSLVEDLSGGADLTAGHVRHRSRPARARPATGRAEGVPTGRRFMLARCR